MRRRSEKGFIFFRVFDYPSAVISRFPMNYSIFILIYPKCTAIYLPVTTDIFLSV
ncbi:Unannotated [Lentimonas sp. CC19]|nr:Unannotated [Lentimonas sp. CC19]CAA6696334.1 Unannotated [Lentimonas sp. CC10]CAA7071284.1 Unannotated [Lentimonas sp. CC11]